MGDNPTSSASWAAILWITSFLARMAHYPSRSQAEVPVQDAVFISHDLMHGVSHRLSLGVDSTINYISILAVHIL
jgi:hypothetical protein